MAKFIYSDTVSFRLVYTDTGFRLVQKHAHAFISLLPKEAEAFADEDNLIGLITGRVLYVDLELTQVQIMSLFKFNVIGVEE